MKRFSNSCDLAKQATKLNSLVVQLENPIICRHSIILTYYDEEKENFSCGPRCDNCIHKGTFNQTDGASDAFKVVQGILELTGKKDNCNVLKLFILGNLHKQIKADSLDTLSTFGSLQKGFVPTTLLEKFLHFLIEKLC